MGGTDQPRSRATSPDARQRRGAPAPLAWFKYYGFFALNVANAFESFGLHPPLPLLQVLLPIGISFYTFMAISYVVDVSRYQIQVSRWLDVSVYLAFFPHLIAGPIVRSEELIPQIRRPRDPGRIDVSRASFLIVGGLFKKMVISSFLASQIVDPVFGAPNAHGGLEVLIAIYAYAIVIYADFSAYSDIAIGVALLLGFEFPANFDRPYTAVSLRLLAPLAHDAVPVVAGLPLHPPRRQPARRGPHGRERHDHDADRRVVARGRVDVRRVGGVPRDRAGDRAVAGATRAALGMVERSSRWIIARSSS